MKLGDLRIEIDDSRPTRSDWRFHYTAKELSDAARAQADYHEGRRVYWALEAVRLEAELMDKGIKLTAQQVTGGAKFRADVDSNLADELTTAQAKRDSHKHAGQTFRAYAEAFVRVDAAERKVGGLRKLVELSIGDVDYFAIHRDPGD